MGMLDVCLDQKRTTTSSLPSSRFSKLLGGSGARPTRSNRANLIDYDNNTSLEHRKGVEDEADSDSLLQYILILNTTSRAISKGLKTTPSEE
jgi:hypothetical protein